MATMGFYVYTDDNGVDHTIRQKIINADAVGNTTTTTPNLPVSQKKLRHVELENTATNPPQRRRVVICDVSNAIWGGTPPATVNVDGVPFDVKGRIGERRF